MGVAGFFPDWLAVFEHGSSAGLASWAMIGSSADDTESDLTMSKLIRSHVRLNPNSGTRSHLRFVEIEVIQHHPNGITEATVRVLNGKNRGHRMGVCMSNLDPLITK